MLRRTLLITMVALAAAIPVPPATAATKSEIAGASPTAPNLIISGEGSVLNPSGDPPTWYATAEGYDSGTAATPTRTVYAGYVNHYDADGSIKDNGQLVSTNLGQTFGTTTQPGFEASARLSDGRVLDASFVGQTSVSLQQRTLVMRYSTDNGATFPTKVSAAVNIAPQSFAATSANFYPNSVIQVPNGPLLMAGYANISGAGTSALLVQSTNAGQAWTLRSVIAQGSSARTFSETAIALNSDGDLISVSRSSSYDNLWRRMSTDLGATWTGAVQGIPEFAMSGGTRPFGRINPRLSLLPNGILALVAGRPDNHIALSYDGEGTTWNVKKVFYDNHSTADPQNLNEGTSGNADFAWTEPNRAVLLADSCHAVTYQGAPYNKCKWHNAPMSGGTTEFQIMRAMADILTADTGKIDLASKAQLGGDLGAVTGQHRSGLRGAVDGSTELWSGAFKQGGSGTFDISLDRPYTLSKAGLSLALGGTQGATVQTKLNAGDAWQDWYSVSNQESLALRYTSPAARKAQYVRVITGTASYCPPGVTAPCSMLNEIELYSNDVDSFENDPVNGIPRGYSVDYTVDDQGKGHQGVWVTKSTDGSGSSRALFITDDHSQHLPAVRRMDSSSTAKTLEFRFHPVKWRPAGQGSPSSFMFDLLNGSKQSAFHFSIWSDGTIRYFAGSWKIIGSGPALDPSTSKWSTIKVNATTTQATVTVNGVPIGTATRADGGTGALGGHQFSASSTADANETFIVDDVHTSNS